MTNTARIEIKTPKVQLKLDHVLYLRSLNGDKVSCGIGSDERARLQILGLIQEVEIPPTTEAKKQFAIDVKARRAAVDKAYREEDWKRLQDAAYKMSYPGTAPATTKKFVLTKEGQQLLKDGGVTIAIKNGCGGKA
jgi:hypothetical protein